MALLALSGTPDALPGALERLRQEKEPWLILWAEGFMQCMARSLRGGPKASALDVELAALSDRARALRRRHGRGPRRRRRPSPATERAQG